MNVVDIVEEQSCKVELFVVISELVLQSVFEVVFEVVGLIDVEGVFSFVKQVDFFKVVEVVLGEDVLVGIVGGLKDVE